MRQYKMVLSQKPTYLHAIVTGSNNAQNIARYLEELLNECIARGCQRVLIEERLNGPRLGTLDIFNIVSEVSERAVGKVYAIAYVDVNAKGNSSLNFAETVAVNRGLKVSVFKTTDDAEKWLLGKNPEVV
jgi:hypothetical protein